MTRPQTEAEHLARLVPPSVALPVIIIIIFFLLQRHFVAGLTLGANKG